MTVQSWSHIRARTRPPEFVTRPVRNATLSASVSTDGSFEHVDDTAAVGPGGRAAGDDADPDAAAAGAGAWPDGDAAGVAATGAPRYGGAARGADLGAVYEGRVVGFATVYVQRNELNMDENIF